jgi:hypothetical protein
VFLWDAYPVPQSLLILPVHPVASVSCRPNQSVITVLHGQ